MKKYLTVILMSILISGGLFAKELSSPVSKMSSSTKGFFTTNIDDYISVVNWDDAIPNNMFGFLGYDSSIGGINWGISHQFKYFYSAFYFGGILDSFSIGKNTNDITDGTKTTTNTTKSGKDGNFDTAVLFGWNNMALLAGVHFNVEDNDTKKIDTDPETVDKLQKYDVSPFIQFGLQSNLKDWEAEYAFTTGLQTKVDNVYSKAAGTEIFTNNSNYILTLKGSMGLTKKVEKVTHKVGIGLDSDFYFFPKDYKAIVNVDKQLTTQLKGMSNTKLVLLPSYKVYFNLGEKTLMGVGVSDNLKFNISKDYVTSTTDGTTVYNSAPVSEFSYAMRPSISCGLKSQIGETVTWNMGASITSPELKLVNTVTKTVKADDGTVNVKNTDTQFKFTTSDGYLSWSSGFTVTPNKVFCFDCSYEILSNIFGRDMKTDFAEGTGTNILNNLNKYIVHNIGIELSVNF